MKSFKKVLALVLAVTALFSFTSCNVDFASMLPDTREPVEVEKPDFDTQKVTYKDFTLELPASWEKTGAADGSDLLVYKPSDAKDGGSTFNLSIEATDLQKYTLVKFRDAMTKSLPQQVAELFPDAGISEFTYSDFRAPCGEVFVAEYTVTQPDGTVIAYTQFYPLINYYFVLITAENKGEGAAPEVSEVARYAANTLALQEK